MNTINKYIDAHCHLGIKLPPQDDIITHWFCNSARVSDWGRIAGIANTDMRISGAIGVHPWYITDIIGQNWSEQMCCLLSQNPHLMIGEIGLHAGMRGNDIETQEKVFIQQLAIANEYKRAVHIHCVHAWDKMLHIFKTQKLPPVIIFHGVKTSSDMIKKMLKYENVHFSFCFGMCGTENSKIQECIAATPVEKILCESDKTMDLSHLYIPDTVSKIAAIKSCDINKVLWQIYNNTTWIIKNG